MKKKILGLVAISILTLSACSIGASTEKQLSETLTKMNDSEAQYRSTQTKLTELEQTEQKTFTETMELTNEDVDQLRNKVTELEKLIEDRLTQLNKEEDAMKEAKAFTEELDSIVEKASDSDKKKVEELKDAVTKRYVLHDTFIDEYKKLSGIQKEFYGMLLNKDIGLADLKEKVGEVNKQNEVVQNAISEFNDSTKAVNKIKQDIFTSLEKAE